VWRRIELSPRLISSQSLVSGKAITEADPFDSRRHEGLRRSVSNPPLLHLSQHFSGPFLVIFRLAPWTLYDYLYQEIYTDRRYPSVGSGFWCCTVFPSWHYTDYLYQEVCTQTGHNHL
jgi:hypothetical protein